jgi:Cu/Ag efflux pump CusA
VAVPLVVRYPAADAPDLEAIRATPLRSATGGRIPVDAVAQVSIDRSPNFISRENVQRKITVSGNVAGRDLGSVVADARRAVAEGVRLPPGYRIEFGGQFESSEQASRLLFWLGLGVVAAMFFMLATAFRSAPLAGLMMVNLPLALSGGIAGVFAREASCRWPRSSASSRCWASPCATASCWCPTSSTCDVRRASRTFVRP